MANVRYVIFKSTNYKCTLHISVKLFSSNIHLSCYFNFIENYINQQVYLKSYDSPTLGLAYTFTSSATDYYDTEQSDTMLAVQMVECLDQSTGVAIKSVDRPGYYLRAYNTAVWLQQSTGQTQTDTIQTDMCWTLQPATDYPGYFRIRQGTTAENMYLMYYSSISNKYETTPESLSTSNTSYLFNILCKCPSVIMISTDCSPSLIC